MTTHNGPITNESARHSATQTRASTIITGTDGLAMLDHGREFHIGIITPVGTSFRAKSNLIGTHSNRMILVELPKINDDKLHAFFQEGFWATIRTISPRGEGAMLTFRSQILHIIRSPIAMIAMSIPQTMQSTPLREEPRFEVNLAAKVYSTNHRIECEIRDLSMNGCLYTTPSLTRPFDVGERIAIKINTPGHKNLEFEPLTGFLCNANLTAQKRHYGVKFDENGQKVAKALLAHLKFDGSKLSLQ